MGPAAAARLASAGVRTIGDLAATPNPYLRHLLGTAVGDKLTALASNIDPRQIERDHTASSVGAQAALGLRDATPELVHTTLSYLADRVAGRLRAGGCAGRTITVRVRFAQLKSVTRSITLPAAICSTVTLADIATELAQTALLDHPDEPRISLLAVSVSHLVARDVLQLELPLGLPDDHLRPGTKAGAARFDADRSVDAIRTASVAVPLVMPRSCSPTSATCPSSSANSPSASRAAIPMADDRSTAAVPRSRTTASRRVGSRVMAYDEELADRLREVLQGEAGLTEKRMFGGLAFLINGNMAVAASSKGGLLLRVDPASTASLVDKPHVGRSRCAAAKWTAGFGSTPQRCHRKDLKRWVRHGVSYARSLPAK